MKAKWCLAVMLHKLDRSERTDAALETVLECDTEVFPSAMSSDFKSPRFLKVQQVLGVYPSDPLGIEAKLPASGFP